MLLLAVLSAAQGCGKDAVPRHNLSGTVTFRGKPVPVGLIVFEPDATKGNRGPQGYAQIFDGQYETEKFGKGAIIGALNVEITGFPPGDGSAGDPNVPLFPPYKTKVEITQDTNTLDFDVPARR
ncbi:MAG: hypothetical protein JW809_02130 [Pirellulales bacterium]|nr:hypothetical protein [Pirellulales bacterium]